MNHDMNRACPMPAPLAGRKLPPVAPPEAVADPGLIRIGAAVGRPVKR